MEAKYIFTADDYGPIDFINRGVCYAVKSGLINSVHVLSNIGKGQLKEAMHQLNESVPATKTLDVGLHLTLTSGGPLYRLADKNWEATWGKMLKGGSFKAFSKFYFGYRDYLTEIGHEFEAQHHQLQEALAGVPNSKLQLTSLSHHHGIFAIDDELFSKYSKTFREAANLAVRSPKALPASANNSFFGKVVPLLNFTDRKEDRLKMESMNEAFGRNAFYSTTDLPLKTTAYTEVGHYGSFGSVTSIELFNKKRIAKKVQAFNEMLERAQTYTPNTAVEPPQKVVEFVFHLGDHTHGKRGFNQAVKNYSGINPNYFEDRQNELEGLQESFTTHRNKIEKQLVSWQECGEVVFKKAR